MHKMNRKAEIILCGDICPTKDTSLFFEEENASSLFNDVIQEFNSADLVVANLEFVLTDTPKPIQKSGPILYGKTNYIRVLKKAGIHLLSLANNHIKDCGEEGVKSSMDTCLKHQIDIVGVGKNINEAKKPFVKVVNGVKIGILAYAEQEFNCANDTEYGSNYFDPYEDLDAIEKLKEKVDFLLVIYHGGIEYYEYPSPLLQKKCRKFVEKGADLVTCQHSHCIGSIEEYKDKKIIYGQGNSIFGYKENNSSWNEGLLLKVEFYENNTFAVHHKGITATQGGIRLMNATENITLSKQIEERSSKVYDSQFIMASWIAFCKRKQEMYFPQYLGLNRYWIHLNRILKNRVVAILYGKKYLRSSHNIMRCESHNEVIQTLFNQYFK
ncbi:CapA family protein [Flavobacterium sp. TP390]|uniref:CapA family protein n=2 Tax=Flavobacterium profundi TaxID=1774945 RepID=A0A6I4IIA1_9FLAO|nr:CapA family protein [Flavobacterium profundi]